MAAQAVACRVCLSNIAESDDGKTRISWPHPTTRRLRRLLRRATLRYSATNIKLL